MWQRANHKHLQVIRVTHAECKPQASASTRATYLPIGDLKGRRVVTLVRPAQVRAEREDDLVGNLSEGHRSCDLGRVIGRDVRHAQSRCHLGPVPNTQMST